MTDSEPKTTEAYTEAFVWANAWAGATKSATPPLIHAKVRELRREIGGLAAVKMAGGPMFPVKSAKTLETKLQPALDKLNLVMTAAYEIETIPPSSVPLVNNKAVRSACTVKCTVRLIAEDGSYVESQGCGGGLDGDDKAVGKASTYSRKDAVMKMLAVPDQSMIDTDDESDVGTPVSSPKAKPALAVVGVMEPDEASEALVEAKIKIASSLAELKTLMPQARTLPMEAQVRLSKVYLEKTKELS